MVMPATDVHKVDVPNARMDIILPGGIVHHVDSSILTALRVPLTNAISASLATASFSRDAFE